MASDGRASASLPRPGQPCRGHGRALPRHAAVRARPRAARLRPLRAASTRARATQQPALFLCSVAAWERPARPDAVAAAGHSLGEYAALVAAGALEFEDAVRLVDARAARDGQRAATPAPGGMVAMLGGDADRGRRRWHPPRPRRRQRQRAGPARALGPAATRSHEAAALARDETDARARPLDVGGAFHSPLMEPAADALARRPGRHAGVAARASPSTPTAPRRRSWTSARSWPRTCCGRCAGARRCSRCARIDVERFVELGPGAVLTGMVKRTLPGGAGMKAGVFGIGAALPARRDHQRATSRRAWTRPTSGSSSAPASSERHWLNGSQTLADLAVDACADALADAGRGADEVDRVIVATITPDRLTPGPRARGRRAHRRARGRRRRHQRRLRRLPRRARPGRRRWSSRGRARCVARLRRRGAVAHHRLRRPLDRGPVRRRRRRGRGRRRASSSSACRPFEMHSDGVNADLLYAERDERLLRMQGREVYRHAVARMAEATERGAAPRRPRAPTTSTCSSPTRPTRGSSRRPRPRLGVPRRPGRARTSIASPTRRPPSIPLALWQAERDGRLRPGATVALAAFGAGFVWGAGVISWKERALVCA